MLAAVKTEKEREIIVAEYQKPTLEPGEVLIKVDFCGVCGSDLHAYTHSKGYEFVKQPIILGHEISGTVIECSDDHSLLGKKVIVESMHYCGECENCQTGRFSICHLNTVIGLHFNGGMAEFVKTKATFVREIPASLSSKVAALSEPMAIAIHAVKKAGEIRKGKVVLVQGPGIIGFFVGLVCLAQGANVILSGLYQDYETRLVHAEKFGMKILISDQQALQEKVDVLFECSGSSVAAQSSFNYLKKGGQAIFVALYEQTVNLFLTDLVRNEWPIVTSYGCDPIDYNTAFHILGKYEEILESMMTYYPLIKASKGFEDSLNKKNLKAVLSI